MFDNESNAKEYFGDELVNKICSIFGEQSQSNFIFVHGTITGDKAEQIMKEGLQCDYPEMYYTSELINPEDKLLFAKFKNWPHWDTKYLVMISLSKLTGKNGYPVWIENEEEQFLLKPEFILGYVDVNNKVFIDNPRYTKIKLEDYAKMARVQDESYEVGTGKLLGISIPPDEVEFYGHDEI